MGKEISTFEKKKIEKFFFTSLKVLFFLENVEIEGVLVSSKISSGEKNYNTLLGTCVMLTHNASKKSAYVESYNR